MLSSRSILKIPAILRMRLLKSCSRDEMRVTATGQVSTSLGGETVFSLNMKEAEKLAEKLTIFKD